MREAQENFSGQYPAAVADVAGRERKARTVVAVLADFLGRERLPSLRVLDIGASIGVVADVLAGKVAEVVGVDIDGRAIELARRRSRSNLRFERIDGTRLPFTDRCFDVVLCMHVYEHVADAAELMREIARVLRPGGICYFAAGNRFQMIEPHYRLPLLSVIPRPLAHLYLRLLSRGHHYYEQHQSYWGLRRLVNTFHVHDYTIRMLREPERFEMGYLFAGRPLVKAIARRMARILYVLLPTYIWILES